ncbi:glycoprotein hormones alpha chain [Corythoichthys intestinalis]|uniref:glycoprotein hormones alpha chain n=1 Tax=Corythoichthys intestinalis TaxID=161448 RepID=UPI0025A527FE|nr:glycoprotein hormones alpha chain [Corythoichthys intestinalis]XP_057715284.1 glycoprotein hormones alpha chain [Corythoichthys intestinalis]XP_057715285.1 glycoprotein hormones alpha chain [Corythoichthys intestinalis]
MEKGRTSSESHPEQRYSKGKTSTLTMIAAAALMGSVKSVGPILLLLSSLMYMADSYNDLDFSHVGCEECSLKPSGLFKGVYQCKGCCFSKAYPTPLDKKMQMLNPKNITSEAACCIASKSHEVVVSGLMLRNHTECTCGTCIYHKS